MSFVGKMFYAWVVLSCALLLIGCVGGGSGGGGSSSSGGGGSAVVKNFQSWAQVDPNTEYEMKGFSLDGNYTSDPSTLAVISATNPTLSKKSSVVFSMDNSGLLTNLDINTSTTSVSFSQDNGDSFFGHPTLPIVEVYSADLSRESFAVDPLVVGWDYQTFGVWLTGLDTGSGTAGSVSAGAPTAVSGIPVSGTATYQGLSGGLYVDSTGVDWVTLGLIDVTADFGARSLGFDTIDTIRISRYTGNEYAASELNLSGNLSYSSNSNEFAGNVSTADGNLSGRADGQFYGPAAQELGGVFNATGSGVESYTGAFGAKR